VATHETLKRLVAKGSDLTLTTALPRQVIFELAELARQSGARLTVTTDVTAEVLLELSQRYGSSVSFVHGLSAFKTK